MPLDCSVSGAALEHLCAVEVSLVQQFSQASVEANQVGLRGLSCEASPVGALGFGVGVGRRGRCACADSLAGSKGEV